MSELAFIALSVFLLCCLGLVYYAFRKLAETAKNGFEILKAQSLTEATEVKILQDRHEVEKAQLLDALEFEKKQANISLKHAAKSEPPLPTKVRDLDGNEYSIDDLEMY